MKSDRWNMYAKDGLGLSEEEISFEAWEIDQLFSDELSDEDMLFLKQIPSGLLKLLQNLYITHGTSEVKRTLPYLTHVLQRADLQDFVKTRVIEMVIVDILLPMEQMFSVWQRSPAAVDHFLSKSRMIVYKSLSCADTPDERTRLKSLSLTLHAFHALVTWVKGDQVRFRQRMNRFVENYLNEVAAEEDDPGLGRLLEPIMLLASNSSMLYYARSFMPYMEQIHTGLEQENGLPEHFLVLFRRNMGILVDYAMAELQMELDLYDRANEPPKLLDVIEMCAYRQFCERYCDCNYEGICY